MHILVDFDGTLGDILKALIFLENRWRAEDNLLKIEDIDHWDHWLFADFFNRLKDTTFQEDFYAVLQPINGARRYMPLLHKKHHIELLTVRPEAARMATKQWLDKFGIPVDSMIFVEDARDKVKISGDLLIDDKPETGQMFHKAERKFILIHEGNRSENTVKNMRRNDEYNDLLIASDWRTIYSYISLMSS